MKNFLIFLCTTSLIIGLGISAFAFPITIDGMQYDQTGASENVTAQFNKVDGGISSETYSGFVELTVSGVGTHWPPERSVDAFYWWYNTTPSTTYHDLDYYQLTFDTKTLVPLNPSRDAKNFIVYDIDAEIDVNTIPYVPTFRSDHIYNFVLDTGTETPQNLHFGLSNGYFDDNSGAYSIEITQLQVVPEPATMLLLGSGLIGFAGFRRKNKK